MPDEGGRSTFSVALYDVADMIQSVNAGGEFVDVNQAWIDGLGYSRADLPGLRIFDLIHESSRAHCEELFRRVFAGETIRSFEMTLVKRNGEVIAAEGSAKPVIEQGQVVATRAVLRDVSSRKRQEESRALREDELRTLLEHSPDVISRFDREHRYTYINPVIQSITGLPCDAFLGRTNWELGLPVDVVSRWDTALREVLDRGLPSTLDFTFPGVDRSFEFESTLIPERGDDGTVESVLVVSRDVTERRQTQEALRRSEQRFQSFMDNAPAVTFIKDGSGRMVFANRACLERFAAADLIGKRDSDWLPEDAAAQITEHDRSVIASGRAASFEETVPDPGGGTSTWYVVKFPLEGSEGERYLGGFGIDVTERKKYEQLLDEYQRRLEGAVAELERLSTTDALTGLKNQGAFTRAMDDEVDRAKRYQQALSLIVIDVDRFKQFNDEFGHPAGDEVLRRVGQLLREHARPGDVVGRVGGEEFAVLLKNTAAAGAAIVGERIRRAIEAASWPQRAITISAGAAELAGEITTLAALREAADRALYDAKRKGRNRVCTTR